MTHETLRNISNFEETRKKMGMSPGQFYAIPRDPPSSSKLPIFDAAHVRNAMARFKQIQGASEEEKRTAKSKIMSAAKKFGIEIGSFAEKRGVMMSKSTDALGDLVKTLEGTATVTDDLKARLVSVLKDTNSYLTELEAAEVDDSAAAVSEALKAKDAQLSEKEKMIEKLAGSKADVEKQLETYVVREKLTRVQALADSEIKVGITKLAEKDARIEELKSKDAVVLAEIEKTVEKLSKVSSNRQSVPAENLGASDEQGVPAEMEKLAKSVKIVGGEVFSEIY